MTSRRLPRTRGYPKCLVWGGEQGAGNPEAHPRRAATVPYPAPTGMGAGPERGPRHR